MAFEKVLLSSSQRWRDCSLSEVKRWRACLGDAEVVKLLPRCGYSQDVDTWKVPLRGCLPIPRFPRLIPKMYVCGEVAPLRGGKVERPEAER